MRVRFWGTRGSIARPGPGTLRYGGNTSCVEVRADDGSLVVLDCAPAQTNYGANAPTLGGTQPLISAEFAVQRPAPSST